MSLAIIGECMIELSSSNLGNLKQSFGGDTYNTAVYFTRLGGSAEYVTNLGDDIYSDALITQLDDERIGTELISRLQNRLPGLYIIRNDASGERYFDYWRDNSPATQLFEEDSKKTFDRLMEFSVLYFSSITLSLFSTAVLEKFLAFIKQYRRAGGKIAFDINYRTRNWESEGRAREVITDALNLSDIVLPSFDDEQQLFGYDSVEQSISFYKSLGNSLVVIKNGDQGCYVLDNGELEHIPTPETVVPVDTTAAGDSFNGGFLAGLLSGLSVRGSVALAQKTAKVVVQCSGAIVDKTTFETMINEH